MSLLIISRFLLAKLQLESLEGKKSPKAVRVALDELTPKGSEAYKAAYDSVMQRIKGQLPDQIELAKLTLGFLTYGERQFSTQELVEALGVEVGEPEFDSDNCPDIDDVLSSCLGLVTIDEDTSVIRLVHYTTQEYLRRGNLYRCFPDVHDSVKAICLTCISFDRYGDPDLMDPSEDSTFYTYAARWWMWNFDNETPSVQPLVLNFLKRRLNVTRSMFWDRDCHYPMARYQAYLRNEFDFDAFQYTIRHGLEDARQTLLQQGAYDLSRWDRWGLTPLQSSASWGGYGGPTAFEQYLEYGADINARIEKARGRSDEYLGFTVLHFLVRNPTPGFLKLGLDRGAARNLEDVNGDGRTPLRHAISYAMTVNIKVLLDAGASTKTRPWPIVYSSRYTWYRPEGEPRTILAYAASKYASSRNEPKEIRIEILKILLATGVDINEREDRTDQTALFKAVHLAGAESVPSEQRNSFEFRRMIWEGGDDSGFVKPGEYMTILRFLLENGADPSIPDADRRTPLACACEYTKDNLELVQTLVEAGAEIDYLDRWKKTAYRVALEKDKVKLAQYLLEHGADPDFGLQPRPDSAMGSSVQSMPEKACDDEKLLLAAGETTKEG